MQRFDTVSLAVNALMTLNTSPLIYELAWAVNIQPGDLPGLSVMHTMHMCTSAYTFLARYNFTILRMCACVCAFMLGYLDDQTLLQSPDATINHFNATLYIITA